MNAQQPPQKVAQILAAYIHKRCHASAVALQFSALNFRRVRSFKHSRESGEFTPDQTPHFFFLLVSPYPVTPQVNGGVIFFHVAFQVGHDIHHVRGMRCDQRRNAGRRLSPGHGLRRKAGHRGA